jgi:succinoglycan biosynthesis transport protein ExoP
MTSPDSTGPENPPRTTLGPWPAPEIDLRTVALVLSRRRWVGIGVLLGALLAGLLVTLRAQRIYRSKAIVVIDTAAPEVLSNVREVYDLGSSGYWAAKEYYETQYNVIRSRPVAQKAAGALGLAPKVLADTIRATGTEDLEAQVARDPLYGLSENLREKVSMLGLGDARSRDQLIAELEDFDVAKYIQKLVRVEPVKDSRLVAIVVEDTNPQRAARLANAVADAYIEFNLDQKVSATRSAADWLTDQMHELKEKLQKSELALLDFKKDNNIVSVSMEDRQTITSETLSQLNRSLSETVARRLALESKRDRLRAATKEDVDSDADAEDAPAERLEEVLANPVVQDLKKTYNALLQEQAELSERYTPEHPKLLAVARRLELVRRELGRELGNMLKAVDEEYETVLETEHRLTNAIEKVKAESLKLNAKEIDYSRLKHERDNNQALYDLVLKREKEADLTELLRVNNIRKLEAAEPVLEPVRPRVKINMLVAAFLGLFAAVIAAFAVDYLDNSIKSQDQIEQLLGLPFLGIIPAIKGDKAAQLANAAERDQFIVSHPRSSVAECCRAIRTNLLFMSHERPAARILVTSSGPQEGKSTAVVNLAMIMAQSGARTIVLDTDMRRPRLHKSFSLPNDRGITSVIMGEMKLHQAIRPTGIERLDVLTCGPIPPSPADLLHTESFRRIVSELSRDYQRIFLDSPPAAAVADALVLAGIVDGIVLVVQAHKTAWQAALEAKRRLVGVGGALFGVVLNDIDLDDKRQGYYYHYYEYYHSGYGEEPGKSTA